MIELLSEVAESNEGNSLLPIRAIDALATIGPEGSAALTALDNDNAVRSAEAREILHLLSTNNYHPRRE